ncbi:MAG: deoxyribodipyrimidine photo-lyase [Sediminicola sp.]|jgi:deoxyribodipyrimidine photo-lyase
MVNMNNKDAFTEVSVFWFRRDLRLEDNVGLMNALKGGLPVLPLFIFDDEILDSLSRNDARVSFLHSCLEKVNLQLKLKGSSLLVKKGSVKEVWKELIEKYDIKNVFFNKDYEPYAIARDKALSEMLNSKSIATYKFKDQVVFEENDILKADGKPYTVYTPYKNKWLKLFEITPVKPEADEEKGFDNLYKFDSAFPSLASIGFSKSDIEVLPYNLDNLSEYEVNRDYPATNGTSFLSPHLRFGVISIRRLVEQVKNRNQVFLSELIWREFFMQILFHFPGVVTNNFKRKYDGIQWRNNPAEFKRWCEGNTGYPLVDAGMRELNETGYMHNRVRMVTASFLCKHLLMDWKLGEAYFAEKLLDYELSSNNGNWQWAAGTGCDAAPYFRVFNPTLQLKKFDKDVKYTRKWIPEFDFGYSEPMVDHAFARERCLSVYKEGLASI